MKSIIFGLVGTAVAVTSFAAPAGATGTLNWGAGGNTAISQQGKVRMGIGPNGAYFEGGTVICFSSNIVSAGNIGIGNSLVNVQPTTVPAANTNCDANEVITSPPANSTVTISGFCDDDAAKLKANVTGTNVTVIVNSTGPCDDDSNVTPVVTVDPKTPAPADTTPTAKQASVQTPVAADPKGGAVAELPQTGVNEVITAVIATVLAVGTYAGVMAVRAFRARA